MKYIIAIDQGTTSCRAILFDESLKINGIAQTEFTQYFPQNTWVEHDPKEILTKQIEVLQTLIQDSGIELSQIKTIGITNQRETTVVWDRHTGEAIYNAIVWQDQRTVNICEQIKSDGLEDYIRNATGLVIDTYFSATKLKWILDKYDPDRTKAANGDLLFGTIDSWLIWHLTNGKVHATDYSNASRTMLYNIEDLKWDQKILAYLNIPEAMMPEVRSSSGYFGDISNDILGADIPINGVAGDQQSALFGQCCFSEGMAKNTYGTGCFMLMNTGKSLFRSKSGLLSTIAWGIDGKISYALEGSIFVAGAAIQWLRDGLQIIQTAPESEGLANSIDDSEGVVVVPAFAGLGAPYWDMYAKGAIFGLSRDISKAHIVRATLESLAFQTLDVLDAMEADSGIKLKELKVDGGAANNNFLMQFQSNVAEVPVIRPSVVETTALGAAALAGLASGIFSMEELNEKWQLDRSFHPKMEEDKRKQLLNNWQKGIKRVMHWAKND